MTEPDPTDILVTIALTECLAALEMSIHTRRPNPEIARKFVEGFRSDFKNVFAANPEAWIVDRPRVTALARAIGSLAEVIATLARKAAVDRDDLVKAFGIARQACPNAPTDRHIGLFREYCSSFRTEPAAVAAV